MAQDELRNKSTEDNPQQLNYAAGRFLTVIVFCLNLLVKEVNVARLIILLCNR